MIIGITGPFASGKSIACEYLKQHEFFEIDVDLIGKEALIECRDDIVFCFGPCILDDDKISSKKLGDIVFESEEKMEYLNSIVHPFIRKRVESIIEEKKGENIVINAAILFKIGLEKLVDVVIAIVADDDILVKRGMERNNFSRERILKIISMQKKYNDYLNNSDYIIINDSSKEDFLKKVNDLMEVIYDNRRNKP